MQWKAVKKSAECLGCRRNLGSRCEPCFDNVLEDRVLYEDFIETPMLGGGFGS